MQTQLTTIKKLLLVMILCNTTLIFAQKGTAKGIVTDETGKLPFVNVLIKGTSIGTTSNLDGEFILNNIPEGKQIIEFSFVGYQNQEKEVVIKTNQTEDIGVVKLSQHEMALDEVVIKSTSFLPSQRKALSIQKNAKGIQTVLAADGIGKLPDRNAAEAVQRMPGIAIERDQGEGRNVAVRGTPYAWTSNLLNGDRLPSTDILDGSRAVDLDVIPSELIEYVIVSKANTPDMEGDAIGGSINFKTRTAPTRRIFNASIAGGYNDQVQRAGYNASVLWGDKSADGKFGFVTSASIWNRPWASDNYELEYNFNQPDGQGYSINNLQLRDYEGERETIGVNIAAEYNINANNKLFIRGLYDVFTDKEFARQHNFNFPEGPNKDINEGKAELLIRNSGSKTELFGTELGGEHTLSNSWSADWKFSRYLSDLTLGNLGDIDRENRGVQIARFTQKGTFSNVSSDNYMYWNFDSPNNTGGTGNTFQTNFEQTINPQASVLTLAGTFGGESEEKDIVGQFNIKYDANEKLNIKFGSKFRNKKKLSSRKQQFFLPSALIGIPNTPISFFSDFASEPYDYKGGFLEELNSPYNNILLKNFMTEDALNKLMVDVFNTNPSNYYNIGGLLGQGPDELNKIDATENVFAGYAMADWKVAEKFSIIGGVRLENTNIELKGFEAERDANNQFVLNPYTKKSSYSNFLPMVHFKYSPNEQSNIRLSYTQSLARPSFNNLNPSRTIKVGGGITQIEGGNPDLKATTANNFDLLGEYFFKDVGVVSAGVFYKDLNNIIFKNVSQTTLNGNTVRLSQPENIENGWLAGVEVAFSKRLTFLPGFLNGFGIDANYTYVKSEVEVPLYNEATGETTSNTQALLNQPENIFNVALFYEKYGLSAKLASNYRGKAVDQLRVSAGKEHTRYLDDNLTLDFNATYSISKKVKVFVEINNLTNEPLRFYHGQTNRPEQVEYYSVRGQLGVRFSL